MAVLLELAFNRIPRPYPRSFRLIVSTGDAEPEFTDLDAIICSIAVKKHSRRVLAVPDHLFIKWQAVGIADYETTTGEILAASHESPTDDRAFWIGSPITNQRRGELLSLADEHPDLVCAVGMHWELGNGDVPATPIGGFCTLPEHCRYRFLIDIEGYGYSGRLKLLLFTGRPVFVQDRDQVEYWHSGLRPFENYIPVRNDLSDLAEKIQWARCHPDKCAQIATNAREFALRNLTREAAIDYLVQLLKNNVLVESVIEP